VFDRYDTDRSGRLEMREVRHLVRDLLPDATDADILYILVSLGRSLGQVGLQAGLAAGLLLVRPQWLCNANVRFAVLMHCCR
jgi:hypothetical protein